MTVATEQSVLRRYLLGELSEAETERLEESIFTDDDVFAETQTAEMSLVDEYVRGEMDEAERKLFEANYLVSPEREAKLRESRIFHSELNAIRPLPAAREEKVGWLERWFGDLRLSLHAMQYASAALVLVLAATTAWLVYDNRKTTNELAAAKNTLANSENALNERLADKERELNDRLAAQRGEDSESLSALQNEIDELHQKLNDAHQKTSNTSLSQMPTIATILLPVARGGMQAMPTINIARGVRVLNIQIPVASDEGDRFDIAVIRDGSPVLRMSGVEAKTANGAKTVKVPISSHALSQGKYDVELKNAAGVESRRSFMVEVK